MDILRIGELGIVAAVLSVVMRQYRPELSMQVSIALGVVVFLYLSAQLSGISSVVSALFREADIQPENTASLRLEAKVGLRREGFSPGLITIEGVWRDHERWAIINNRV